MDFIHTSIEYSQLGILSVPKYYTNWLYTLVSTIDCRHFSIFCSGHVSGILARPHKILIGQKAANWPQYLTSTSNTKQVIPTLKSKRGSGATTQLAQNSRSTIFIWVFTVLGTYNFSKRLWQLFAIHALPSQFSQCEFVWHVRLPMHGRF